MKQIPLIFFALIIYSGNAQNETEKQSVWRSYLQLESSSIFPLDEIREGVSVRQNVSSYYVDQTYNGNVYSDNYGFSLGFQWRLYNKKWKTGISTGLRYTGYRANITGYTSYESGFFYLRYTMDGSNTKFARVKRLTESNHIVTIPLEIRYNALRYLNFEAFLMAGAELGYNLQNNPGLVFHNEDMEIYENDILNEISEQPNDMFSTLYGSIGISYGKENRTRYSVEVFVPSLYLTKNNFSLLKGLNYQSLRISVQFPLTKQNREL